MSSVDDIYADLEAFGLTRVEAKTYVMLLSYEEATIGMLARSMGVHVPQLYGILEKLEQKGFVIEQPGRPKVYKAVEPQIVLSRILRDMSKKRKRLIKVLSDLRRRGTQPIVPPIWIVRGRKNVVSTAREMIESAEVDILLSTNYALLANIIESLASAKERGVQIFIYMFPQRMFKHVIERVTSIGRVRLGRRGDFILIADSTSCLFVQHALFSTLNLEDYALLTEEPSLVDMFMHNFINRWISSKPVNDMVKVDELPHVYTCHRLAMLDIKGLMDKGYTVHVEVEGYDTKTGVKQVVKGLAKEVLMDFEEGMYNVLIENENGKLYRAGGIDAYIEDIAARKFKVWV